MSSQPRKTAKQIPFHVRRIVFPEGKGWIALSGTFNPFELSEQQRDLLWQIVDLFGEFEKTFPILPEPTPADGQAASGGNKEE